MRNVLAIFRREFASYFDSPLAYIVIPAFLMLVGGFSLFFQDLIGGGVATMRPVFFWSAVFYLLLIPAVTMRLFAEENRTGSIELLVTMPISEGQMVLGKYLAALALMTLALGLTITYPLTLSSLGDLDPDRRRQTVEVDLPEHFECMSCIFEFCQCHVCTLTTPRDTHEHMFVGVGYV